MSENAYCPESLSPKALCNAFGVLRAQGRKFDCGRVYDDLTGTVPISEDECQHALSFLEKLGIVRLTEGEGEISGEYFPVDGDFESWKKVVGGALARNLSNAEAMSDLLKAAHWNPETREWVIDRALVPWRQRGLRTLLAYLGILNRSQLAARHWSVSQEYQWLFRSAAEKFNSKHVDKLGLSEEELRKRIAEQEVAGSEAEEWVLARERSRLRRHPMADLIQRISVKNSAAGYDIASFQTERSIIYDRMIEVKSHAGTSEFFWSANEIETAKRLGDTYYLILVDRRKMLNPEYVPITLQNPYDAVFCKGADLWSVKPTQWRVKNNFAKGVGCKIDELMTRDLRLEPSKMNKKRKS